jgi:hypothetical protein
VLEIVEGEAIGGRSAPGLEASPPGRVMRRVLVSMGYACGRNLSVSRVYAAGVTEERRAL